MRLYSVALGTLFSAWSSGKVISIVVFSFSDVPLRVLTPESGLFIEVNKCHEPD
jgi:hypothetical protein